MADEPATSNEFEDAFTKFSGAELPELSTGKTEEPAPEQETTEDTAEEVAAEEPVEAEQEGEGEPEPEAAEAKKPEPEPKKADKPAAEDEALLSKLDKLLEERGKAAEKAPEPQPQEQPKEPADPYTPEERAFLDEYENEWSDVSKAEALKRRVEYNALMEYVFNEVAAVLRPMTQDLQALSQDRQKAQYRAAVPEYDTLQDSLVAWAESQPAYLREAYQHVIQNGNPEDVADLVERYKKETEPGNVVESPKQKATELPTSAKKAAQALAPVSSKRSSVVAAEPDKNDFEGAFDKFAAMT